MTLTLHGCVEYNCVSSILFLDFHVLYYPYSQLTYSPLSGQPVEMFPTTRSSCQSGFVSPKPTTRLPKAASAVAWKMANVVVKGKHCLRDLPLLATPGPRRIAEPKWNAVEEAPPRHASDRRDCAGV